MKVHAFLRNPTEHISIEFQNQVLKFSPNEAGHVVAEIPDAQALDLIDAAPCSFKPYGDVPSAIRAKSGAPLKFDGDLDDEDPDDEDGAAGGDVKPDANGAGQLDPVEPSFVITSPAGEKFDLGAMNDDEVRAFAERVGAPKPHHMKKGDALRAAVIESLKAPNAGE
jgi:hypothetical protein